MLTPTQESTLASDNYFAHRVLACGVAIKRAQTLLDRASQENDVSITLSHWRALNRAQRAAGEAFGQLVSVTGTVAKAAEVLGRHEAVQREARSHSLAGRVR